MPSTRVAIYGVKLMQDIHVKLFFFDLVFKLFFLFGSENNSCEAYGNHIAPSAC